MCNLFINVFLKDKNIKFNLKRIKIMTNILTSVFNKITYVTQEEKKN